MLTRDQVPVEETWDLTALYPSAAAWEEDAERAKAARDDLVARRGTLGDSAAALAAALGAQARLNELVERLYAYAMLKRDENTADPAALERFDRVAALATEFGAATAFVAPEILAVPPETLAAYAANPALAAHRHNLDDLVRHRPHVRSAEVEAVLAGAEELARAPDGAFTALDNADLTYGTIRDADGAEIELTKARVAKLLQGRDRAVRRAAATTFAASYRAHRHTLAALHAAAIRRDVFYARVRGYGSARDAALFEANIPPAVYDTLIDAVHAAFPAFHRYLDLRRRVLGIPDELRASDLYVPLAELATGEVAYREAVTTVLEGLAPLGARYVGDLGRGLASRWVDVHETAGKRSGGYNLAAYGAPPYILMNWAGTRQDVYTLAHEAGHAMHGFYSNQAQPFVTAGYTIFVAEVASTVNETLLTWHLLDRAASDAERFAVLAQFLDDVRSTLVRQTLFAEFERWTHARVEAGAALTADNLSAEYARLFGAYFAGVAVDEPVEIEWARVPHFYRGFYVYQYATGLAAAIALARAIREEGAPAVERYLAFLASGGSDYSIELLRRAGVDMTTPAPVRAALDEFARRVDEATALFDAGAVPTHE
ncbi:MAG TPA: oligoendopeptidase F [Thermomicrobiales bacterium]|nr:oligoendopeptidase F [Thermomicrobiales bacterium]